MKWALQFLQLFPTLIAVYTHANLIALSFSCISLFKNKQYYGKCA